MAELERYRNLDGVSTCEPAMRVFAALESLAATESDILARAEAQWRCRVRLMTIALAAALGASGQTTSESRESDVWMERGRVALAEYRYHDATEAFQKVIAVSPARASAHALLARSLMGEAPSNPFLVPDTNGFLIKAEAEATRALDLSPNDPQALSAMAGVQHKLANSTRDAAEKSNLLAQAISLWKKVLDAEPGSKEAHTELASITIEQVGWPIIMARTRSGMAIGEKGRVRDEAPRRALQEQYGHAIDEAMLHARKALELDPTYVPAMRAMSGLLGMRANLRDSDAEFDADFKASEEWQRKAAQATPKPAVIPGPSSNAGAVMGAIISQTQIPPGTTTMIFASASVAERNLLKKIEPSYPDAAKKAGVQGTVFFKVVIGTDGHVKTLELVKGNPLLVKAAEDAVKTWVYRPFVADGIVREAATEIAIPFTLEAGSPSQKNR